MTKLKQHDLIVVVSLLFLFVQRLWSATYHVPADFELIQHALDATAAQGDTVLVAPGRYIENLDYLGKDIVLSSYYQLGGDEALIQGTILDGGQNGAVVLFRDGESRAAVLNGFTVTNGSGYLHSIGGSDGGGISIRMSSPSITNCRIVGNQCIGMTGGGGMHIAYSDIYLSNVTIAHNLAQNRGGGIFVASSSIEMDPLNRCSIYHNNASGYSDIYQHLVDTPSPRYYLDTASIDFVDDYFMGGRVAVDADILHGCLTQVAHDLWVSPLGDDQNSGTTEDDPLKTLTHAYAIIDADSLHPRSIHLLPGTYAPSSGQLFPINLRSYVSLIGAGRDATILDLEGVYVRVFGGIYNRKNCTIRSMSVLGTRHVSTLSGMRFMQCSGTLLEDIRFADHEAHYLISAGYFSWMDFMPETSTIVRNCIFEDNHCVALFSSGVTRTVLLEGCRFDLTTPLDEVPWPEDPGLASAVSFVGMTYPEHYPFPYSHRIERCSITRNVSSYDLHFSFSPSLNVHGSYRDFPLEIVNCTIADNTSPRSGGLQLLGDIGTQVRIANCLFWDNLPYQLRVDGSGSHPEFPLQAHLSHCLVQDPENGIYTLGNAETHLLDGNIEGDPLFVNEGEEPYRLTGDSPAVDAGIAFWVLDGDTVVNLSESQYSGSAPDIGAYEWVSTDVEEEIVPLRPESLKISSISPNPFNPKTRISFHLPTSGKVALTIYTISGQHLLGLVDAWFSAGNHSVQFDASGFASGVYIAEIQSNAGRDSQLLTLAK